MSTDNTSSVEQPEADEHVWHDGTSEKEVTAEEYANLVKKEREKTGKRK